jgi:hypothetical protein
MCNLLEFGASFPTRVEPMLKLRLSLDFACCACEESLTMTVDCEGKGLAAARTVAAVTVPCPLCGQTNQVCFHPTGTVVAVRAVERPVRIPLPSLN